MYWSFIQACVCVSPDHPFKPRSKPATACRFWQVVPLLNATDSSEWGFMATTLQPCAMQGECHMVGWHFEGYISPLHPLPISINHRTILRGATSTVWMCPKARFTPSATRRRVFCAFLLYTHGAALRLTNVPEEAFWWGDNNPFHVCLQWPPDAKYGPQLALGADMPVLGHQNRKTPMRWHFREISLHCLLCFWSRKWKKKETWQGLFAPSRYVKALCCASMCLASRRPIQNKWAANTPKMVHASFLEVHRNS